VVPLELILVFGIKCVDFYFPILNGAGGGLGGGGGLGAGGGAGGGLVFCLSYSIHDTLSILYIHRLCKKGTP